LDLFRQRPKFPPQHRLFASRHLGAVEFKSAYLLCGWEAICAGIETGSQENELRGCLQSACDFIVDPLRARDACRSGAWQLSIEEQLHQPASCIAPRNPVNPLPPSVEEQRREWIAEQS
jgi:hypothetical protein